MLSKTWKIILWLVFAFHGLAIAYDLFDAPDFTDVGFLLRLVVIALHAVICLVTIKKGMIGAILYTALTAFTTAALQVYPKDDFAFSAGMALQPLNFVFSSVLFIACVSLNAKKRTA